MLKINRFLLPGLLMISVAAFGGPQVAAENVRKQPDAAESLLAEQNFEKGQQLEYVPGFRMKGWTYVDPWHLTVVGDESQSYLVTLQNKCYGLGLSRAFLIPRNSKHDRLAKNDEILVKNNGRTVAHCKVKEVHQLDPLK